MTFVGSGCGDYTTETSYRYVGLGTGEFKVMTPKRSFLGLIIAGVLAVVIVVVLVLLLSDNATTTTPTTTRVFFTTTVAPPPRGECLFWGDPHISTFDHARPSFYGEGEFWIVKSESVKIQGRFMGTEFTHGLAATQKIVVSGSFIGGHKIEAEVVRHGGIYFDGQPILPNRPSTYPLPGGLGTLVYDGEGELVDKAQAKYTKRVVHMHLPNGIEITVFRWSNYLDLRIVMAKVPGMDGVCGNLNGDPGDDSTQAIFARVGARVGTGELLFGHRATVVFTPEMEEMLSNDCEPNRRMAAEAKCRSQLPQSVQVSNPKMIDSCAYDQCFGQMEHALRVARNYD